MGVYFTDQFSLLHFASGIIAYYWKTTFFTWFGLHLLYEWITNTSWGIYIINHYTPWPWGHLNRDSPINIVGDQIYGLLGWIIGYAVVHYFYDGNLRDVGTTTTPLNVYSM